MATRTSFLPLLERHGATPREWLQVARSEQQAPILVIGGRVCGVEQRSTTALSAMAEELLNRDDGVRGRLAAHVESGPAPASLADRRLSRDKLRKAALP